VERHTPQKNKVGWPRNETKIAWEVQWREKLKGEPPRGRPRDKFLGKIKKDTGKKSHREVNKLAWNREERRAAVYHI
jgi:hypothetical protein